MIDKKFTGWCRDRFGQRYDIPVELVWNPDEPLLVVAHLTDPGGDAVSWRFGRDLLIAGAGSLVPVGRGDVKMRRNLDGTELILCLSPGTGHVDIILPIVDVLDFLSDTGLACPPGSEKEAELIGDSLDRLIEAVYEEGDRA
jgi:hypothetical protein